MIRPAITTMHHVKVVPRRCQCDRRSQGIERNIHRNVTIADRTRVSLFRARRQAVALADAWTENGQPEFRRPDMREGEGGKPCRMGHSAGGSLACGGTAPGTR